MSASWSVDLNLVDIIAPFQIGLRKDITLLPPEMYYLFSIFVSIYPVYMNESDPKGCRVSELL